MQLDDMVRTAGEWLRGVGPDSDIVMSSRVRLARNLADFPFISRASEADRLQIEGTLRDCLGPLGEALGQQISYHDVAKLSDLDRQFLVERHLISRELSQSEGPCGVAIGRDEQDALMVNEEDHLRIQVMRSGFDLATCWDEINRIDDALERQVTFAFSEQLGYLTACPTNVGAGMRVSVMLHLPGLVVTKEIDKVFRSLQKLNLVVRGFFGEGSKSLGDFYQISNQITLGRSETDLLQQVSDVVPVILKYERRARQVLNSQSHETINDQVQRAYATLRHARTISSEETMKHLSSVRMGVDLGLIPELKIPQINELFIATQRAHLQKLRGSEMDTVDRNIERARYLREQLSSEPA